jgi:uncharacterized protein
MQQTVLITGGSSGIGRELAEWFAADRYHVVLAARSEAELAIAAEQLTSKHSVRVTAIPVDLTAEDAIPLLMDKLERASLRIDVLVNNAGFGVFGPFAHTPEQDELAMIDLNIRNLTRLTKCVLPSMLERRRGGIMNVASTAALQPGPFMAVYYAAKSYVLSFTEALASELRGTGIQVTALCPGPTETRFAERANAAQAKLFAAGRMQPAEVARQGYRGYRQGRRIVIPGWRNRVMAMSIRFVPRTVVLSIVKYLHRSTQPT